ncbi:MAG: MinD/ParA family protein [Candidatus Abyssobacteria bacterium SURF_17]|uniref:MinD/ParA family protein n=1 Tax=Candidatus Abyssobacteria bacterium SURF_17 TaxID=2093361 RepID=A0A419EXS8_9BACT|nr:MAG: MinD/ParA family protein [Candidatus Abyssubacteria bacterium SURF_17]
MSDQAEKLRALAAAHRAQPRVITVTSGKGGVGKSNIVINLAIAVSRMGKRVLVIDADLGLANVDILLGLKNTFNLQHAIDGKMKLRDIVVEGPAGIKVIPGSSGIPHIANMNRRRRQEFITSFKELEGEADMILIDTSAGMTRNVITFALLADDIILVTTPEPSAITDAYAMIKVIHAEKATARVGLVVNLTRSETQALEVADRIAQVSRQFLNFPVSVLGTMPTDPYVPRAVMQRQPWSELYPKAPATKAVKQMAARILNGEENSAVHGAGFIQRVSAFFKTNSQA